MSAFETLVRYQTQTSGQIGLELFPPDKPRPSINTDSLAHAKCVADPYPGGFAHGHTMRDAHTFRLERREGAVTTLRNRAGHRIEHQLTPRGRTFEVRTTFFNDAREPVTLEMLTSFSLGGISGQLRVHRSRSGWSAEGRHELQTIDNCTWKNPGPAWARSASASDKSEHCRSEWFPFVAIEDVASGITWGHSWPGRLLAAGDRPPA
jgi:alpha-galactosidase